MPFTIKASDTAGYVVLHREDAPAAIKKAGELSSDGCWDVEVIGPDGAVYWDAALSDVTTVPATVQ